MDTTLFLITGILLIYLGGKDPALVWTKLRNEGFSISKSMTKIIPMFILPWPRTVNKRLLWLAAGTFLVGFGIYQIGLRFL